jgi:2'-5' RNA ligase
MSSIEKFSLWLVPPKDVHQAFEQLILRLSERHSAPVFGPHVTLLGGISGEEKEIASVAEWLTTGLSPLEIGFSRIEYLDEYYRCLYLRAEDTGELTAACRKAEAAFGLKHSRPFMPHLSLMYGDYPATLKEEIISEIGSGFPRGFKAESLSLYRTGDGPETWGLLREFPLGKG